ncbi:hypothetical protein [Salinigranum halophilum]|uniref:hypothetical protein n=1 Tax=Salinigranum halophilum TaxID=2565931 RepID=UPI0010A77FA1|nr:hypothetical protein [Salinigranum halophilum]
MVDKRKFRCAECDNIIFEWDNFRKACAEFATDSAQAAIAASAGGLVGLAGAVIKTREMNKKVKGEKYMRKPNFVEESDKAFCNQECCDKYYSQ